MASEKETRKHNDFMASLQEGETDSSVQLFLLATRLQLERNVASPTFYIVKQELSNLLLF